MTEYTNLNALIEEVMATLPGLTDKRLLQVYADGLEVMATLPGLTDKRLLQVYADGLQIVADSQCVAGHIEQEIQRRMAERGATAIPSEDFVCEVKTVDAYSQPSFAPLKEVFGEADLQTCLTPAHEEMVQLPDKWNTVKTKALARRYGDEALRIVESARVPGAPKLKFARRG